MKAVIRKIMFKEVCDHSNKANFKVPLGYRAFLKNQDTDIIYKNDIWITIFFYRSTYRI